MEAIVTVKGELIPRLDVLIEHLQAIEELRAAVFFTQIRDATAAVTEESELLEVFLVLSTLAFQGFTLDPLAAALSDEILAYAEQVSHAFTASTSRQH